MSANTWLIDFHAFVQKKSEQLARLELEKGELEATLMLVGTKIITLFPEEVKDGEQVPDVVIRLLEELEQRRKSDGISKVSSTS